MKPKRIFILRHGESEGNADKNVYKTKPDYALLLTTKGQGQAVDAGHKIKGIIEDESVAVYYSPFFRSRQTTDIVLEQFRNGQCQLANLKEDPRLREQEWTNRLRKDGFMTDAEMERDAYGHFYYRFKGGESCADVYDRVSDFFNTLHRDFEKDHFPNNVIISAHGMTNRLIIMRWFHLTTEEFEMLSNPKNCEFWMMELDEITQRYKMVTDIRRYDEPKHKNQYPFDGDNSITQRASLRKKM